MDKNVLYFYFFFFNFFPWTVKLAFEEQGMKQQEVLLSRYKYVMA